MAKPLTPIMRARLIAAYDHAVDLQKQGFHALMIIRALQSGHSAFYGYRSCTDKLCCAGVEVNSNCKNHVGMLATWMQMAAQRLEQTCAQPAAHAAHSPRSPRKMEATHAPA